MAKFRVAITRTETISDAWDYGNIELDNPDISDTDFSLIGQADDKARAVL